MVTQRSTSPGTARIPLFTAKHGTTMIGSPRIRANLDVSGAPAGETQIAARLWDIGRDGSTQHLVARGSYRPRQGKNVWQLHPGSWRFRRGHTAELELLGADVPYGRPSNSAFKTVLRNVRVRTPVR